VYATAADGQRLYVQHLRAATRPRGVALLLHAMMVDRRSMDRPEGQGFGSLLAARGFEVLLADYRGHGESRPLPRVGAAWSYDDLVRLDTPALLAFARQRFPRLPLFVCGQSLGGHVTLAAVGTDVAPEPDGVVALSAATYDPRLVDGLRTHLRRVVWVGGMEALARTLGRFPSRHLRLGPADEAAPYVHDLWRFTTRGWFARDGRDYLLAMAHVHCPVLGVYASGDRLLAPLSTARAWLRHAGSPDLEYRVVGGGAGGVAHDPGHMDLVGDPRCRPAWEGVARWLEARCPRSEP